MLADGIFDLAQQDLADTLSLCILIHTEPVEVPSTLGQGAPAITGKAEYFAIPPSDEEVVPRIDAFGDEFGPQLADGDHILRAEQLDAAR